MNLELLISPSGLGKTEHIVNEIVKTKDSSKIIVLTPEQNGYNFEKILCDNLNGTFNIDVVNFSSLSKKLVKEFNKSTLISDEISTFYYLQVAENLKNSNNFLADRIINDVDFIQIVDNIIKELKEYNVNLEQLEEYISELEDSPHKDKIMAIYEIYTNYNLKLQANNKLDKNDYIDSILLCLDYIDLSDYTFYIDGYYNFTPKEYLYIEKLIKNSKKVIISVISDITRYINCNVEQLLKGYNITDLKYNSISLNDVNKNITYSIDIYRKSHEIIAYINNIIKNLKISNYKIITMVQLENQSNKILLEIENNNKIISYQNIEQTNIRYQNILGTNSSLIDLVNEYPKVLKSKTKITDNNVQLFEASDMEVEIKQVARNILKIKKEYKDKGLILNNEDIAILYRNSDYEQYKYIFKNYNLDVHIDKDISIENHRLIKLIENILNFDDNNFSVYIINILKTRLTNFNNIYKRYALNYICYDNFQVTKNFEKKALFVTTKDINLTDDKKTLLKKYQNDNETIATNIKDLSIEDVEKILKSKLVKKVNDLDNELFLRKGKKYSTLQLEIVKYILQEINSKILKIRKSKTVEQYVKQIANMLDYFDVKMLLEKEQASYDTIEELEVESIDRQVYKKFLVILDNLQKNLESYSVKFSDFCKLFLTAIRKIKYRSIPIINDVIIMSVVDLAKIENKKVVFVIGFNKNVLPRKIDDNSILDDIDKKKFIDKNIFLSPTSQNLLIDEEFVSYIALSRSSDKVIISYSKLDINYKEQYDSIYLNNIKNIFENIKIQNTDKILKFNINNIEYYKNNLSDFYTEQEFNYIYGKLINSYFTMTRDTIDLENNFIYIQLKEILCQYSKYSITNKYNINMKKYNIDNQLVDEIYDDNLEYNNNYVENLKEAYNFFLSTANIQNYLENNKNFSKFSSSKIKDYFSSPYIFFVKRILGIYQEDDYSINALNKGNFYHAVMEDKRVTEYILEQGERITNLEEIDQFNESRYILTTRKLVAQVINNTNNENIIDFMAIINSNKINSYILSNIINRIINTIISEIYYVAISGYKIKEVEKEFKFIIEKDKISCNSDEKNIIINLNREYNIPTISFVGKIDRIDEKDNKYLLVDYKSSETDFSYPKFYNGEESQILTYLLAVILEEIKIEQILGIFYRKISKNDSDIIKDSRLRGLTNIDVLLNEDFYEDTSKIMMLRVNKNKKVHGSDTYKILNSIEFKKFMDINIDNILTAIEKIYKFDYSIESKTKELNELYLYAKNERLTEEAPKGNSKEIKELLINKEL